MTWKVMVGAEEAPWPDVVVPLDPPSGWAEGWDDIVPGYRRERFDTEVEANAVAQRLRAHGLSAATEVAGDDEEVARA
jgi:hypothetical protein